MKINVSWLLPIAIPVLVLATVYGVRLYKELTLSVQVDVQEAPAETIPNTHPDIDATTRAHITDLLLGAGLNSTPLLDSTGVSGHIDRLVQGTSNPDELQQYAQDLNYLNQYTASRNGPVPTNFWDARTQEMSAHNWTEYSVVHQLAQPGWEPYLLLLARGYGRFLKFRAEEESGQDTALDTALDMFAYVEDYYHSVSFSTLSEHAKEIKGETEAVLMIWQSLVAGSTRTNPLTHNPLFSHNIFSRDNVGTMYQYDQGERMSVSKVWGVSGFAPHFVGIPENANQIEHMSISIILQMVMHEPVLILDGIEEEKLLLEDVRKEEAYADMALNNAIHKEFAPFFAETRLEAVERLRLSLKGETEK